MEWDSPKPESQVRAGQGWEGFVEGLADIARVFALAGAAILMLGLLIALPWGLLSLVGFLLKEARIASFLPGMAIYILGLALVLLAQFTTRGRPSSFFGPPRTSWLILAAVEAIALGQLALSSDLEVPFSLCFLVAAAAPPLVALCFAAGRLPPTTTWRRILFGVGVGSFLSTHLTIVFTAGFWLLTLVAILPLRAAIAQALAQPDLEKLFYSPALVLTLISAAVVAPCLEELMKPLRALILARRLRGPSEAFLLGMAGGVGFAIMENMLYEAAGLRVWGTIAVLRAVGGVLHPLNAGLVALGWYAVRSGQAGGWTRLARYYGTAVGIHALWNGGLVILYSGVGAYFFGREPWTVSIYGVGQPLVVVLFLLFEAAALWRLLFIVTAGLAADLSASEPVPTLTRTRHLAGWAGASALLASSLAALYGPLIQRYWEIAFPVR